MATKKLYSHTTCGGINSSEDGNGACLVKNMINVNGINEKRQGHQSICQITDNELLGMRINGIYNYFCIDEDGTFKSERIVHARDKLFRLDSEFSNVQEIQLADGITLNDQPSRAFPMGKYLWIVGAGDLLLYDGEMVRSARLHENAYIPDTTTMENESGTYKKESPNLLTKRRVNRFVGTSLYRDSGSANVFLLDDKIKYGTKFVMEIKVRTRTSEEEPNATTSSFIGVDELGTEVDKIVTIRYERESIKESVSYFLTEPIRDEAGNVINIKKDDKVYAFNQIALGMRVKNGREIMLPFDVTSPSKGEANIYVEYEPEDEGQEELIKSAEIATVSNGDKGGQVLLLSFGDNKIYFTDEKKGFFYLPRENKISLGSDGEKINAIIKLSENLVGVFKEHSFYRIKFTSSNDNGYEIYSSTDSVGAYSSFSSCVIDYDCLVFNDLGVFGVSEYKSTSNVFNCLRQRSTRINSLLLGYSREERKNAKAISFNARYYLFISNDVYIADTRHKYKESSQSSDAFEYEWWLWDNCSASALYTDGISLYFGTENGQIRKFVDSYSDIEKTEYKQSELSLLLNDYSSYTEFVIPRDKEIDLKISHAYLSPHRVLISKRAVYENGVLYFADTDLFTSEGDVKIFEGDILEAYDKEGNLISQLEIKTMSVVYSSVTIEDTASFKNGNAYDVYLYCPNGHSYGIKESEGGILLLSYGEPISILAEEGLTLTITEESPIECIYKTKALCFDVPTDKKTLYKVILRLPKDSEGMAEVTLETERAKIKKVINKEKQFLFDSFSFDSLSFDSPFKISYPIKVFLRNFENLTLEIKSKTTKKFGFEGVDFLYNK